MNIRHSYPGPEMVAATRRQQHRTRVTGLSSKGLTDNDHSHLINPLEPWEVTFMAFLIFLKGIL